MGNANSFDQQDLTPDTTPAVISYPDLQHPHQKVYLTFTAASAALQLTFDENVTEGETILAAADQAITRLGPFPLRNPPRYLFAAASATVTVTVIPSD